MRFGVVELSSGIVIKTGKSFGKLKSEVEDHTPSRWDNPILVVLPKGFRPTHEEGELSDRYIEETVVAVPRSGWGYGAQYSGLVNENRRKFRLPGHFEPPEEMVDVIGFREKFSSLPPSEALLLLASSSAPLSEPGARSVEYKLLEAEIDIEKTREKEETPKWARDILEEKKD